MELTDFPQELQFEFLFDLPYKDIVSYSLVNKEAMKLCRSEFWNMKLQRTSFYSEENGFPKPTNISIIRGEFPAIKYRILEEILESSSPELSVLRLRQPDLLRFYLSKCAGLYSRDSEDCEESEAYITEIINLAKHEDKEMIELLWLSTPLKDLFEDSMYRALECGMIKEGLLLNRFIQRRSLDLVLIVAGQVERKELTLDHLDEILGQMEKGVIQAFTQEIVEDDFGFRGTRILDHLIKKYGSLLDLKELFLISLEQHPKTKYLSEYIL